MTRKILLIFICSMMMFSACKDDPTGSSNSPEYFIEIRNTHSFLRAMPAGVEREREFSIIVNNEDGVGVSGMEVSISVLEGNGQVTPQNAITNENGNVSAAYSTIVPLGRSVARLKVSSGSVSQIVTLTFNGSNPPANINLISETPQLLVSKNTNGQIKLEAVVTDEFGVGVPGLMLKYELAEFSPDFPVFGSISGAEFTDDQGRMEAAFRTDRGAGKEFIIVRVDEANYADMNALVPITVRILEEEPRYFSIVANPTEHHDIHPDSLITSDIIITVKDQYNFGVPNLRVNICADIGTLQTPALTDSSGMITVQHSVTPSSDVESEGNFTATITAELPDLEWTETATIKFFPIYIEPGTITMDADRPFIWSDGAGLSLATLTVILKDADGQVMSGEEIVLTKSFLNCAVQTPVITDSMGIARAVFDDNGEPSVDERGMPAPVVITAAYPPMDLEASVELTIREWIRVTRFDVLARGRGPFYPGDSMEVHVTCYLNNGSPAPHDTELHFLATYGHWRDDVLNARSASNWYYAPDFIRIDTCHVYVTTPLDTVYSNPFYFDLVCGPPAQIDVTAEPDQIPAGSNEIVTISATVTDERGNPVRPGTYVSFSSSQGGNDQSAVTDVDGTCSAQFSVYGSQAGAIITATVDSGSGPIEASVEIETIGGPPHRIRLELDPDIISVPDIGGNTVSNVRGLLFDRNSDPVLFQVPVIFEISGGMGHPQGPAFFYNDDYSQSIEVISNNGIAEVEIHSGTISQNVEVNAHSFRDEERENIIRSLSKPLIVTSMPWSINISNISINRNGRSLGGSEWSLDVSITVSDDSNNPVAAEVPVTFSVEPDIATIEPALTGNPDSRGISRPGVANTTLVYHSGDSFSSFELTVTARSPLGEAENTSDHVLPFQEGVLELNIDPANWMFREDREVADIRVWAVLHDGNGVRINNAPILFTSNRARFWWMDNSTGHYRMFFPRVSRKFTGQQDDRNDEEPGTATVYLRASEEDIFNNPFLLEDQVYVHASVEGYEDISAGPVFIFFTRDID